MGRPSGPVSSTTPTRLSVSPAQQARGGGGDWSAGATTSTSRRTARDRFRAHLLADVNTVTGAGQGDHSEKATGRHSMSAAPPVTGDLHDACRAQA